MGYGEGQTALVVGGSRGIGEVIAIRLARSGFDICLSFRRSQERAQGVKEKIESLGVGCELLIFDVADRAGTREVLGRRFEDAPPHVVVFNAGVARDNLMVWMKDAEWDEVLRTNLDGFYNVVRPLLFPMLRVKRGRIIAISSTSGQIGQAGQVNYSAAKAGLIGAAKALAREVGRKNILVNVVAPGLIETEMTQDLPKERILPLIPLNRFGAPDEVASVVDFLAGPESAYVHGQVIGVNGGLAM